MIERDSRDELSVVLLALADAAIDATDEEVREAAKEVGEDLEDVAARVRALMMNAVKKHRYQAARDAQRKAKEEIVLADSELPTDASVLSSMLANVLAQNPELTVQFRDLDSMTPKELRSTLKHLARLGLLKNVSRE